MGGCEVEEIVKCGKQFKVSQKKHHPNKSVAVRSINSFNESVRSHFREIL